MAIDLTNGDAREIIAQYLDELGLNDLRDQAWSWIAQGASGSQVETQLRGTTSFQNRFRGIFQRQRKNLPPLSVNEYLAYERQAKEMFRAAGLPTGFYDQPDDFADFIANDVSLTELNARVNDGYVRVSQAPPEVRNQLQTLYGMNPGDMAAYFLDESRALPLIQRQVAAAERASASVQAGYGQLSQSEAESLTSISQDQAISGFEELGNIKEITQPLPGEDLDEPNISREEQFSAAFQSNNPAKERIRRRQEARKSEFSGKGQYAQDKTGSTTV